jgi:hypothetical protein
MKVYGGENVYIHIFLTSAIAGDELSALPLGKEPWCPVDRRLDGSQAAWTTWRKLLSWLLKCVSDSKLSRLDWLWVWSFSLLAYILNQLKFPHFCVWEYLKPSSVHRRKELWDQIQQFASEIITLQFLIHTAMCT